MVLAYLPDSGEVPKYAGGSPARRSGGSQGRNGQRDRALAEKGQLGAVYQRSCKDMEEHANGSRRQVHEHRIRPHRGDDCLIFGQFRSSNVVAAMILLSIVGCSTESDTQNGFSALKASAHCQDIESVFAQLECFVALADARDDPSLCSESSIEGVELQCYAILAERRSDKALCNQIPLRSAEHQSLRDICISDVAKKVLESRYCEEIVTVGLRDSCYAQIGKELGDLDLCKEIGDAGIRSICSGEPVMVQ